MKSSIRVPLAGSTMSLKLWVWFRCPLLNAWPLAALIAVAPVANTAAQAQSRIGPSFQCDAPSVASQPLAQIICSSSELASDEMRYVIAYQALRHSLDDAGKQALARSANELVVSTTDICQIPKTGRVTGAVPNATLACIRRSFDIARRNITDRLTGDAALEVNLTPGDALKIQSLLKERAILPQDAVVDGVFGPATRAAIAQYQRLNQLPSTGYASRGMLTVQAPPAAANRQSGDYNYGGLAQPSPQSGGMPPPAPLDDVRSSQTYNYGSSTYAPQSTRLTEESRQAALRSDEARRQEEESRKLLEIARLEAERAKALQEVARLKAEAEAQRLAGEARKEQEARDTERKRLEEEKERNRVTFLAKAAERIEESRRTCKPVTEPAGFLSSLTGKSAAIKAVGNNAVPLTEAVTAILPFALDGKEKDASAVLVARLVSQSRQWNDAPQQLSSDRRDFVKIMQLLQNDCLFDALDYFGSRNVDLLAAEAKAALGYEMPSADAYVTSVLKLVRPSDLQRAMSSGQIGGGQVYVIEDKRQADIEQKRVAASEQKRVADEKKQREEIKLTQSRDDRKENERKGRASNDPKKDSGGNIIKTMVQAEKGLVDHSFRFLQEPGDGREYEISFYKSDGHIACTLRARPAGYPDADFSFVNAGPVKIFPFKEGNEVEIAANCYEYVITNTRYDTYRIPKAGVIEAEIYYEQAKRDESSRDTSQDQRLGQLALRFTNQFGRMPSAESLDGRERALAEWYKSTCAKSSAVFSWETYLGCREEYGKFGRYNIKMRQEGTIFLEHKRGTGSGPPDVFGQYVAKRSK